MNIEKFVKILTCEWCG